ncbi:MAG: hypothetical protein ACI9DO_001374 [Reinekea sp.]|jgi:hypothetical protein|uniref:Uncharacterized protein n=1 Tax=Pseudoalteromonas gelatinilytica TaxID=1703256 RepID=A0ABQ1UD46_9GAMM|nr:hypothetical protein [Pseudoalteromonas profundi]GGF14869.1 hypothetical protein GCM10008027_44600 [Pseudoalteromonas profundi]|tara:strand:- start:5579 stop:5791 length:213 start_codon:yes stop_codon:yes gene_type:complete
MSKNKFFGWLGKALTVIFFFADDEEERTRKEKKDLERFSDGVGGYNISGEHMTHEEAKFHKDFHGTDHDY